MTFSKIEDTDYACEHAKNIKLDDNVLLVDYENSHNMKGWVPRRLGYFLYYIPLSSFFSFSIYVIFFQILCLSCEFEF